MCVYMHGVNMIYADCRIKIPYDAFNIRVVTIIITITIIMNTITMIIIVITIIVIIVVIWHARS